MSSSSDPEIESDPDSGSEVICHESSLFPASFGHFAKLRKQSKKIDIVIKSGPLRFEAHQILLISAIPYFETQLLSSFENGAEISIEIPGVEDPEIVISGINSIWFQMINCKN